MVNLKSRFGTFTALVNVWCSCMLSGKSTTRLKVHSQGSPSPLHTNLLSIDGDSSSTSHLTSCRSTANWPVLLADAMNNYWQRTKTPLLQLHQSHSPLNHIYATSLLCWLPEGSWFLAMYAADMIVQFWGSHGVPVFFHRNLNELLQLTSVTVMSNKYSTMSLQFQFLGSFLAEKYYFNAGYYWY